jgi:hypothetical protein
MKFSVVDEAFAEEVLVCESTADGWRGLMRSGEVFNVAASKFPTILEPKVGDGIASYLTHVDRSLIHFRGNKFDSALEEIEQALAIADTRNSHLNRAVNLLSLGRWHDGFSEWDKSRSDLMPTREKVFGKRVVVKHEGGFGDTIMFARYVSVMREMFAADVVLDVPAELAELVSQLAPISATGDVVVPTFAIVSLLNTTIMPPCPYLKADKDRLSRWASQFSVAERRIGIAWTEGHLCLEKYRRSIPLDLMLEALDGDQVISLQIQDREEAEDLGVICPSYANFADVAAVIELCDEVVSIDTAAINLAGAMGHTATVLLPWNHSWRWKHGDLYPTVRQCSQDLEGDWVSCLSKL